MIVKMLMLVVIELMVIDILVNFHSHFVKYGVSMDLRILHLKTSHMKVWLREKQDQGI